MSEALIHMVIITAAYLLLFGSAEMLYHVFTVRAEITRKYVHVLTGVIALTFPFFVHDHWIILVLSIGFLLLLATSLKWGFLPSINAVKRTTHGSLIYPVVIYGCFYIYTQYSDALFYYVPILVLACSDPLAELIGRNWPYRPYRVFGGEKTVSGSVGFFLCSIVITFSLFSVFRPLPFIEKAALCALVSLVATIAEGLSQKGYDNLTIPSSIMLVLFLYPI